MTFVVVMLAAGVLLWGLTVVLTARALLRPARLTPARAMARLGRMCPSDIGLRYSDLDFVVQHQQNPERVTLTGWWIAAGSVSQRTVVIVHGYGDSRAGALAWAPVWLDVGFNVLLIDLRAHGESGGRFTTAGLVEQFDIRRIVADLRARKPAETTQLMLFGVSLGATIVLAAATEIDELAGIVLDSPVADFVHGAVTQSALIGLPGPLVIRPGVWLTEHWLGGSISALRPADLIGQVGVPVLAMLPQADPFLPPAHADEIRRAVNTLAMKDQTSQVVDFEGAAHLLAAHHDSVRYRQALQQFVNACTDFGLARASAEGAAVRQTN